jgi:hypothetical protein
VRLAGLCRLLSEEALGTQYRASKFLWVRKAYAGARPRGTSPSVLQWRGLSDSLTECYNGTKTKQAKTKY